MNRPGTSGPAAAAIVGAFGSLVCLQLPWIRIGGTTSAGVRDAGSLYFLSVLLTVAAIAGGTQMATGRRWAALGPLNCGCVLLALQVVVATAGASVSDVLFFLPSDTTVSVTTTPWFALSIAFALLTTGAAVTAALDPTYELSNVSALPSQFGRAAPAATPVETSVSPVPTQAPPTAGLL